MSTPQRRLTRANTRVSQTPASAQSPAQRRKPRRSEVSPLPEVSVGTSYAYGSGPKVHIDTQVPSVTGNSLFKQFDATRGSAVNRDAPTPAAKATPGSSSRRSSAAPSASSRKSPRKSAPALAPLEENIDVAVGDDAIPINNYASDDEDEDDAGDGDFDRSDEEYDEQDDHVPAPTFPKRKSPSTSRGVDYSRTELDTTFDYVAPRRFHFTASRASINSSRLSSSHIGLSPAKQKAQSTIKWSPKPVWNKLRAWQTQHAATLRNLFAALAAFIVSVMLIRYLPPLDVAGTTRAMVDSITSQVEAARNATNHNTIFDPNLYGRIEKVETDVAAMRLQWSKFTDLIPEQIAVRKNPKTGAVEIPEGFYNALVSKLNRDDTFPPGSSGAWADWLDKNQAKIHRLISASADEHVKDMSKSGTIISRATFLSELEENSSKVLSRVREDLASHRQSADKQIKAIASSAAANVVSKRQPSNAKSIEDLRLMMLAQNLEIKAQRNYLNPHVGAVVNPRLTSQTYRRPQDNWAAEVWYQFGYSTVQEPNPPVTALTDWSEAGECWCAAISEPILGQAEIAVMVSRLVRPRALIVEHIPKTATWDFGAAPKELEVWGYAPSLSSKSGSKDTFSEACQSPPPADSELDTDSWICLGTGTYEIHDDNHMQVIVLHEQEELVSQVLVKALGNWGGEQTCFYRLRVLGADEAEVADEKA